MVGSAIIRKLESQGFNNIVCRTSAELDLRNQAEVERFFQKEKPDYVFLAAARVGGIVANNTYRAEFIYDNILIQSNLIHQSWLHKIRKLLFLGSSCIYPRLASQPMKEEYLLTGLLEDTNEPYAIAKIAGIKMCDAYRSQYGCNFISAMPTNLFGPNDNYDLNKSHVLPALMRKVHTAKMEAQPFVEVWGSGNPRREFLHVDDMADACVFLMEKYNEPGLINIGCGEDITIRDLALLISKVEGYTGTLKFDSTRPDGTPRKLLDVAKLHSFGWKHRINLEEGIRSVYEEYKKNRVAC